MRKSISNIFVTDQTLILRSYRGERRLSFSRFHQILLAVGVLGFALMSIFLTANYVLDNFIPSDEVVLNESLRDDYEARIDELVRERDSLSDALSESRANSELLISTLADQQELLFDLERNNYELANNLKSLRGNLVSTQTRFDTLNLQLETQQKQLAALENGDSVGADSSTLSTITATLAETATARDEARAEVQNLRQQIAVNEQEQESANRRREILFQQIEETLDASLVPLKSTLKGTGLNIDALIRSVQSEASIGGLDSNANLSVLSNTPEGQKRVESIVGDLEELSALGEISQNLPIRQPVLSNFRMTSGFGYRRHPISGRTKMHNGQDMAGPVGTPIYATGAGKVIHAGWQSGYGKTVRIQHAYGLETLYGHMSRVRVKVGDYVNGGTRIGDMGSTGNSTGSHLHYEVHVNGVAKNPNNFLKASKYVQ